MKQEECGFASKAKPCRAQFPKIKEMLRDEWWRRRISTTGYYTEHRAGYENAGEMK
jgi:hypothetical protein